MILLKFFGARSEAEEKSTESGKWICHFLQIGRKREAAEHPERGIVEAGEIGVTSGTTR